MILLTFLYDEYTDRRKLSVQKKHSWTSPDVQFKEFSLTRQKIRPRIRTNWENHFQKKSDQKTKKNLKTDVKMPYVNKRSLEIN